MLVVGLEPTQAEAHKILSLARLPIPPHQRALPIIARMALETIWD